MSVLRCDLPLDDYIVWRHPESSPGFGSQIIVSQSQQVALLASGELVAILEPGSHTLETANIPGIKNFLQSGVDSFPFDIWFFNKTASTNFRWGTKTPVQVRDKQFGLLVPIGSYGNYELQIRDVQAFLLQLVGVSQSYSISDLREYLYPLVERETKDAIAELAVEADVFTLATELNEISETVQNNLSEKFLSYGLSLKDFFVQSISVLSDDPSFEQIKNAIAESAAIRMKASAVEQSESGYRTERSLDVLEKLAGNEGGAASAFAGAGLGLGAGLNIGNQFTEMSKPSASNNSPSTLVERLKALKDLLDAGAITQEDYDQKKESILNEL